MLYSCSLRVALDAVPISTVLFLGAPCLWPHPSCDGEVTQLIVVLSLLIPLAVLAWSPHSLPTSSSRAGPSRAHWGLRAGGEQGPLSPPQGCWQWGAHGAVEELNLWSCSPGAPCLGRATRGDTGTAFPQGLPTSLTARHRTWLPVPHCLPNITARGWEQQPQPVGLGLAKRLGAVFSE